MHSKEKVRFMNGIELADEMFFDKTSSSSITLPSFGEGAFEIAKKRRKNNTPRMRKPIVLVKKNVLTAQGRFFSSSIRSFVE